MPKDKTTTTETPAGTTTVEERPQTETTTTVNKPVDKPVEPVTTGGEEEE